MHCLRIARREQPHCRQGRHSNLTFGFVVEARYPARDRKLSLEKNNVRLVGFLCVCERHCHACRFSGDDKRAEVLPKAFNFGFGGLLFLPLFSYGRSRPAFGKRPDG
jgi:hypothetical protein